MSFDLSRVRFDARRDFLGVVMQQGRVQLDSDWNEWASQLARRFQAGSLDGLHGNVVPRTTPDGFLVEAAGGSLRIGPGRIYVDGLLAENHGGPPDVWDERLGGLAGTAAIDYNQQPYLPSPPPLPQTGRHLVYVDVWQREITAVQEPGLIEPALGVDTTGRLQTVWQVRLLENVGAIGCSTEAEDIPGWVEVTAPSASRLTTSTADPPGSDDPCQLPPAAGYRGLENQLYRVEVHTGGPIGTATFKWSRDNGSIASRVTHINPTRNRVTLETLGRDSILSFHAGDWVEVTDDWRELHGLPGELRRIQSAPGGGVDAVARTLTLEAPLSPGLFPTDGQNATDASRNTRVRRWDQSGPVLQENGAPAGNLEAPGSSGEILIPEADTALFLEHGILVRFSLDPAGGEFRSGDHWVFAARSTDASLELLVEAPPLGIHHHHARLAIVEFPEGETDCRTLWPPLAEGQGCACSVCVDADDHNSGVATLQQAIDSLRQSGGTICLGIGSFTIREPLNLHGVRSLRLRGQGWATLLLSEEPGALLSISRATGVAVENLSLIGSAAGGRDSAIVSCSDVVDLRLEHLNVFGLAHSDSGSVGIGLSGHVMGVSVSDCAIIAERGIARTRITGSSHLLSAEMRACRNLFFCSERAVSFDAITLHFGITAIEDNLIIVGNGDAIVATGGVLTDSSLRLRDNVIATSGRGIRVGTGALTIEGNSISGYGNSGDALLLEEGIEPGGIDQVTIYGNRISDFQGNGIVVLQAIGTALIQSNCFDSLGLGVLVMADNGAIETLHFSSNQAHDIGLAVTEAAAFAALQLVSVERADILDNVLARIAATTSARAAPAIHGLRGVALGRIRLAGNRLFSVGPPLARQITAIRLSPPFVEAGISDNQIDRVAAPGEATDATRWMAIDLTPEPLASTGPATDFVAPVRFLVSDNPPAAYLLTATRLSALSLERRQSPRAAIRNNQVRARATLAPLCQAAALDHCLFTENLLQMEAVEGGGSREPLLGLLQGRTLIASNNRLIGLGDLQTLWLHPGAKQAVVIGNISTGPIVVQDGVPVPAEIPFTNIIGT